MRQYLPVRVALLALSAMIAAAGTAAAATTAAAEPPRAAFLLAGAAPLADEPIRFVRTPRMLGEGRWQYTSGSPRGY
jgi:hypothetical protein